MKTVLEFEGERFVLTHKCARCDNEIEDGDLCMGCIAADELDPPMICPRSKEPCVRAFCEDYGCADEAGVPIDEYDVECGSIDPDELIMPPPRVRRKR